MPDEVCLQIVPEALKSSVEAAVRGSGILSLDQTFSLDSLYTDGSGQFYVALGKIAEDRIPIARQLATVFPGSSVHFFALFDHVGPLERLTNLGLSPVIVEEPQ